MTRWISEKPERALSLAIATVLAAGLAACERTATEPLPSNPDPTPNPWTPVEPVEAPTMLQTSDVPSTVPDGPSPQPGQAPPVSPVVAAQAPKAAPRATAQKPTAPEEGGMDYRRIGLGCGCLLFLAVVACGAALFLLDALAPDALYCGPLTPLYDLLGFQLGCT